MVHLLWAFRELRDTQYYRHDELVKRRSGLKHLLEVLTIGQMLAGADERSVHTLHEVNRQVTMHQVDQPTFARVTTDFSGSMQNTRRHAESTAVGFTRKRKASTITIHCSAHSPRLVTCWRCSTGPAYPRCQRRGRLYWPRFGRHSPHATDRALPKSVQPKATSALHDIWQMPTREEAEQAFDHFIAAYGAKYPKATYCLIKDRASLLSFYDFPAVDWKHLRTTNPIESSFATTRHRTDRAKGCVTRDSMLHIMFKLSQCAEQNRRKLRSFAYLAKVIEGVKFVNREETEQPSQVAA